MPQASSNKQDFGLKLSIPGISVENAGDYQYIFNSGWPSIGICYDETFNLTAPASSGASYAIPHNLGFWPMAFAYCSFDGIYAGRANIGRGDQLQGVALKIGKNNFYITIDGADTTVVTVNIKAYNIDLTVNQSYRLITPPAISYPYNPDFGLKATKDGKSVDSKDLRDYAIHSRAQSPAILSVTTEKDAVQTPTGFTQLSYENPGGYIAWIYGFLGSGDGDGKTYQSAGFAVQAADGIKYVNTTFNLQFFQGAASLVVLRDPLFASNNVSVKYG